MMKKLRHLIFIATALLTLNSCMSFQNETDYDAEEFTKGKKGLVFLSFQEWGKDLYMTLRKAGTEKYYSINGSNDGFFTTTPNYGKFFMLDPGLYYIDSVQLNTTSSGNFTTYRKLLSPGTQDNIVKYGAFRVYANKVHYFDTISYLDGRPFSYKNNLAESKKALQEGEADGEESYKNLLKNIKRSKFYKRGSLLYKNKENRYALIDSETVDQFRKKRRLAQKRENNALLKDHQKKKKVA